MIPLEREPRHFGAALVKLVNPFWGKPRIAALLRAMVNRVQALEDAAWAVLGAFDIDTADDARLAILGRLLVQPNFGFTTEEYRAVLRGKIATNRSLGLAEDLINVIRLVTGTTQQTTISAFVPATLLVTPNDTQTDDEARALRYLLPRARAAGVQQHVAFSPDSATSAYDYTTDGLVFGDAVDPVTTPGAPWFDARML